MSKPFISAPTRNIYNKDKDRFKNSVVLLEDEEKLITPYKEYQFATPEYMDDIRPMNIILESNTGRQIKLCGIEVQNGYGYSGQDKKNGYIVGEFDDPASVENDIEDTASPQSETPGEETTPTEE